MDNESMRNYMDTLHGQYLAASFSLPGMSGQGVIELPNDAGARDVLDVLEKAGVTWNGVDVGKQPLEAAEWLVKNSRV